MAHFPGIDNRLEELRRDLADPAADREMTVLLIDVWLDARLSLQRLLSAPERSFFDSGGAGPTHQPTEQCPASREESRG